MKLKNKKIRKLVEINLYPILSKYFCKKLEN